jgi:hypothetical protein
LGCTPEQRLYRHGNRWSTHSLSRCLSFKRVVLCLHPAGCSWNVSQRFDSHGKDALNFVRLICLRRDRERIQIAKFFDCITNRRIIPPPFAEAIFALLSLALIPLLHPRST